ncbi:MAG: HipA domain-containing protein [Alphaproteobacteria bacterium]|nr:HipA domain-containing protein [Alphaproteobacteria bacterium]
MAHMIWGKVFYKEHFAGFLREEPGEGASFAYDASYLSAGHPAIAYTLPLQPEPHISQSGLHSFFDNLVSEGWLEDAQTRLLGKRAVSRFKLLLAFGQDCAGAVSVIDPEPSAISQTLLDMNDPKQAAILTGRASLSGVQPKLAAIEKDGKFYPARVGELSTYIVKFPSQKHADLIENEFLTMAAAKALLPGDLIAEVKMKPIEGFSKLALLVKRFDRGTGKERFHFEELNQLLGRPSRAKYDGAHKDMADFIRMTPGCLLADNYKLYLRILAGLLLGNTDMHLKNFAMFHTATGFLLTPIYDMVATAIYDYKTIVLKLGGAKDLPIGSLKPRNLIRLGEEFQLNKATIKMAHDHLAKYQNDAKDAVAEGKIGDSFIKDKIIDHMEKRWNGTFELIGRKL